MPKGAGKSRPAHPLLLRRHRACTTHAPPTHTLLPRGTGDLPHPLPAPRSRSCPQGTGEQKALTGRGIPPSFQPRTPQWPRAAPRTVPERPRASRFPPPTPLFTIPAAPMLLLALEAGGTAERPQPAPPGGLAFRTLPAGSANGGRSGRGGSVPGESQPHGSSAAITAEAATAAAQSPSARACTGIRSPALCTRERPRLKKRARLQCVCECTHEERDRCGSQLCPQRRAHALSRCIPPFTFAVSATAWSRSPALTRSTGSAGGGGLGAELHTELGQEVRPCEPGPHRSPARFHFLKYSNMTAIHKKSMSQNSSSHREDDAGREARQCQDGPKRKATADAHERKLLNKPEQGMHEKLSFKTYDQ
ncbi:uncharacterized protein LOC115599115 [Calypte anna]|uniref:uncharacterized protein LOC115599115 n=1 Tax=Calypte anna TaxID=9244 RepID=UPI0011C3AABF|nr:uncharacterized protein LOC115599115 [Calypte anna]